MKIIKYEKQKNGMYQVFFDNDYDVDLHEEIILKYNLLINEDIAKLREEKMVELEKEPRNEALFAINKKPIHIEMKALAIIMGAWWWSAI